MASKSTKDTNDSDPEIFDLGMFCRGDLDAPQDAFDQLPEEVILRLGRAFADHAGLL